MNEAGEASLTEVAASFSPQASQKYLASMGGGDLPRALGADNLSRDVIPKVTTVGAMGKVPKKVIPKWVQGSVKLLNVKNRYGFISSHDTQEGVFVHQTAIPRNNPRKFECSVGEAETVELHVVQGERGTEATNQAPGVQGQDLKGRAGKIKKSPNETPAFVAVDKKSSAPEEENPLVVDTPSAIRAE
ncbi:hypothetical protein EI555_014128 [Monodon monoceros]|uniref:CSD domain-containing protein n=1 Tax=Monodon monoceros TaxID=40151 RepID=A0A4U1ECT3_MONMO|nr:hypothetical protein EI555_014128 [Monodon monoceros]